MSAHAVSERRVDSKDAVELRTIEAIDITGLTEHLDLWRRRGVRTIELTNVAGLPGPGHASPMGYWLRDVPAGSSFTRGLPITIRPPGDSRAFPASSESASAVRRGTRPPQTVRVKAPNPSDGELVLTIAPDSATVVATDSAWNALAEPVLLAICQYWRFGAIDAEIDRLTVQARGDLDHATLPSPASLRKSGELAVHARAVRWVLLELPHFYGSLSDPYPYCSSERSVQVYASLAEKLHFEEWAEAIDDYAEAVEDTYEAVTEKLFEYKNFAWEFVLESLIICVLLAELGVTLWETFAP
jgi:hypothetical protein